MYFLHTQSSGSSRSKDSDRSDRSDRRDEDGHRKRSGATADEENRTQDELVAIAMGKVSFCGQLMKCMVPTGVTL